MTGLNIRRMGARRGPEGRGVMAEGLAGAGEEAAEVFNQNSIDDFLGLSSGANVALHTTGIDALLQTQTVPYARNPRLESVFDRLVKQLRLSMRQLTSDAVEIRLDRITAVRLGRYLDTISLPALLGVMKADPWSNYGLMTVDSSLVYALTDVVFGGGGDQIPPAVDGRSFSSIELNMVRRFCDTVFRELGVAFGPICDVRFKLENFETNPRFIAITQPQNAVLLATIKIELGTLQGYFDIVLPYASLEPIREALDLSYIGDSSEDLAWHRHLLGQAAKSSVELTAVMHEQPVPLRRIMGLAIGDTLYFNTTPDRPVQLRCDKMVVTQGTMGRLGENIAIQITQPARALADAREE